MQVWTFHGLSASIAALASLLILSNAATPSRAQTLVRDDTLMRERHLGVAPRDLATQHPRSEDDQALINGWPFYRTDRGQAAFNDAMATLKATDGPAPTTNAFKGCAALECSISLPALRPDGWLPPGRIWVSPSEYVLVVHSPRLRDGQSYRRRSTRDMRVFVFHEFHNSTRNTDLFDTVSAHKSAVFVPLYMSRQMTDAKRRRFVIVLQVAPHDVMSIHAVNHGSAGPGIEVAKNASDPTEPLQNLAGIVVASIIKTAAPHLRVVNHRNVEGLPMLEAYERRLAVVRGRSGSPSLTLPFVPAAQQSVASASGLLGDLIVRPGVQPSAPLAKARPEPKLIAPIQQATRPRQIP